MNQTLKRYLFSTLVTFLAGFALTVLPQLQDFDTLSLQDGVLTGLFFAGVRAGVKAVVELAVTWVRKPTDSVEVY